MEGSLGRLEPSGIGYLATCSGEIKSSSRRKDLRIKLSFAWIPEKPALPRAIGLLRADCDRDSEGKKGPLLKVA